jgi:SAM-dependent methyltransferase
MGTNFSALRPIHPFPARMAPSIVWRRLHAWKKPVRVLDPMAGSGTTIVAGRLCGHHTLGFDTDPLALLIARAWSCDIDPERIRKQAEHVLASAKDQYRRLKPGDAYPFQADDETRAFLRFWFDVTNRRQLTALARAISAADHWSDRCLLWCALSRLVITKQAGASLAMDVSHSRPHRVFEVAPIRPLERFLLSVNAVLRGCPFSDEKDLPRPTVRKGDARKLPLGDETVDVVITSPPYLNAIDYLRGHKFSLVWMGHRVSDIRSIRSQNVGAERSSGSLPNNSQLHRAFQAMGEIEHLSTRFQGMLARYVRDMNAVFAEIGRVLKKNGEAVLVVGNSMLRGVFLKNSRALTSLGEANGLVLIATRRRPLLENRRYLPPPGRRISGKQLRSRMREEVVLRFSKM